MAKESKRKDQVAGQRQLEAAVSKNLGGRPPYEPNEKDRRAVETMTIAGIAQEGIARAIGISVDTMVKYYREEIDTAVDKANTQVAGSLFKKAISDEHPQSATAAIFWLKTRAGWRETGGLDVTSGGEKLAGFNMYLSPSVKPDPDPDE